MKGAKGVGVIRRVARLPKNPHVYKRYEDAAIQRGRKGRPIEAGDDPLEQRAIPKGSFPNATLPERIIYKKLQQMNVGFSYQRAEGGGRNIIGGFVVDFVITDFGVPGIGLEVFGEYWHQAKDQWKDLERAFALARLGYEYYEISELDVYQSDEHLESILRDIFSRRKV